MWIFKTFQKYFLFILLLAQLPHTLQAQNNCGYTRINGKQFWRCMQTESVFREGQTVSKNMVAADLLTVKRVEPDVLLRKRRPLVLSKKRVRSPRYGESVVGILDLGVSLGLTSFSDISTKAGKKTPTLGILLSAPLSSVFRLMLSYSYQSKKLLLGLEDRQETKNADDLSISSDSRITTHLVGAEVQAFLGSREATWRPFLGLGLGYSLSQLEDTVSPYSIGTKRHILRQSNLGALLSLGLHYRVDSRLRLLASARFFDSLHSFDPSGFSENKNLNLLEAKDSTFTSTNYSQFIGGIQYSF